MHNDSGSESSIDSPQSGHHNSKTGGKTLKPPREFSRNKDPELSMKEQLKQVMDVQQSQIILNIGGTEFTTSRVTLKSDPNSIFTAMLESDMKSRGGKYFFDRDPHHFRFILNYLRKGGQVEYRLLPRDAKYLYEIYEEAKFYNLQGLVTLVSYRLATLFSAGIEFV